MDAKTIPASASATGILPIAVAAALGLCLIFVAGFANGDTLHDLTHDSRHALAFPCH